MKKKNFEDAQDTISKKNYHKVTDKWDPIEGEYYGVVLGGHKEVIHILQQVDKDYYDDRKYIVDQYSVEDGEQYMEITIVGWYFYNDLYVNHADEHAYMVKFDDDKYEDWLNE